MKDQEIMSVLLQADQKEIEAIYEQFRAGFRNTIMKIFNCTDHKALSVYPEAFTNFYFNIKKGKIQIPLQSKLITYLIAIGKNVFTNRYFDSYKKRIILEDDFSKLKNHVAVENIQAKNENMEMVIELLKRIGEPCKEILTLFYLKNYSIESIRNQMNMISEGAVRKKKFDCIMQMRKLITYDG